MKKNINKYLDSKFKNTTSAIENKFSFTYSLSDDGSSNLQSDPSNITILNVSPKLLNFQLLVRNKTLNGNFDTTSNDINIGDIIELKVILTNLTTYSTNPNILIYFPPYTIFEFIEVSTPTTGSIRADSVLFNWTSIYLNPGETAYAICTFKVIGAASVRFIGKNDSPILMYSLVTFKIDPKNNFSLIYSKNSDGSSSIGPTLSNNVSLNVAPDVLKVDLLVRNKSLNGNFSSDLSSINKGDLLEFKIILTNVDTLNSINNISTFVAIPKNILAFLESPTPTIGKTNFEFTNNSNMMKLNWIGINSLAPGQSVYALATFKPIGVTSLYLFAKTNCIIHDIKRYVYSSPAIININPENNFSLVYSKVNDGSSNIGPTPSNDIYLNISSSVLNVELLARNKSLDENFSSDIPNINKGALIEFKIILTNVDPTNSISNISTFVEIPKNILAFLESPTPTVGETTFDTTNNSITGKLSWIGINSLAPQQSVYALATFNSIEVASLCLLAKTNCMIQNIKRYIYSPPINIKIIFPLTIKKEQRIYSAGGGFTESLIDVVKGEIIQYRLTVNNPSNQKFYNIKITDVLDSNVTYVRDSITNGDGHLLPNSKFISSTASGTITGKIEWTIEILDFTNGNNLKTMCFKVVIN